MRGSCFGCYVNVRAGEERVIGGSGEGEKLGLESGWWWKEVDED